MRSHAETQAIPQLVLPTSVWNWNDIGGMHVGRMGTRATARWLFLSIPTEDIDGNILARLPNVSGNCILLGAEGKIRPQWKFGVRLMKTVGMSHSLKGTGPAAWRLNGGRR